MDPLRIAEGASSTFQLSLENLGDQPLTGLTVTVFAKPSNLNVTATLPPGGSVAGQGSVALGVAIQALQPSATPGDVILRVTSAEGVRLDIPINVTVDSLRARLVANPAELVAGMKVGGQALVDFVVSNEGSAPSDPVDIALPGVPWMQVATPNPMPSLAPGATNHILLQLRPAADLPLGAYEGSIVLSSGGDSVAVPYNFRALSEAKGDLLITTVDEYTFYAEGAPKVAGASVVVSDAVTTTVVASGLTDAAGQFAVNQLPEGYYEVRVTADKHSPFRANTLVVAGRVNPFQAFPRREAVRYIWKVIPTEVLDRTRITIETVFEAFVPMPVITVDPPLIDLSEFTADVTQVDLKVENHGLIAAKEAKLSFGTHPDWSFEPLITELGDIPARSSFTIPLLIKRAGAGASARISLASVGLASGGGGCSVSGNCSFIVECGGGKLGGGAGIAMINASASGGCGGGGGGGGGGSVSGRPGGGGSGGGGAPPIAATRAHPATGVRWPWPRRSSTAPWTSFSTTRSPARRTPTAAFPGFPMAPRQVRPMPVPRRSSAAQKPPGRRSRWWARSNTSTAPTEFSQPATAPAAEREEGVVAVAVAAAAGAERLRRPCLPA